jgi:hypothetical protein
MRVVIDTTLVDFEQCSYRQVNPALLTKKLDTAQHHVQEPQGKHRTQRHQGDGQAHNS